VSDAEFYISKINEVYQNYSEQGRQKLDGLNSQLRSEKDKLAQEAGRIESEIRKMREQIQAQEKKLSDTRNDLAKIEDKYKPQHGSIQQKLAANDQAMQISIQKLNSIKEGILKYLK
jgi:predicted  nucleic acid-binding Zn-ribbon protein